ncbi:MAG: sulfatase-like hydrolase/transferase [Draconibacterium sp.]|nr:sulfatase-like hydrolase/transferase [Draconibacterium sp.]
MQTKTILIIALLLMGGNALFSQTKPNILVIITDQQRIDDMSCAGNKWVKTPALDALASRGTRFTNSYCVSPLCVPSRASLATSRMPYEVMNKKGPFRHIPDEITSAGPLFREAGYRTAWSGKWHVRSSFPKTEAQGGDLPGFEVLQNKLLPAEVFGKPEPKLPVGDKLGHNYDSGIADQAIAFLKEKQERPFLLTVSLVNPHDVCGNNEQKLARYSAEIKGTLPPLPKNLDAPNLMITPGEGKHPPRGRKDNWKDISFQRYIYEYYRFTEESDRLIGKVLAALKASGLEKNTIVIFTSDHGEMAGSHHIVLKTVPYEEAMAVPFLIAGPGIPSGVVDKNHFISGLDMLPTLCNLAGIKIPSDVRGLSVNKILKNPSAPWREAVFATVDNNQERVVRTDRYKYIRLNRPDENEVLFDMQNDSGETQNLASNSEYAGILEHHRKLLNDWMKKTNDPFIEVVK